MYILIINNFELPSDNKYITKSINEHNLPYYSPKTL